MEKDNLIVMIVAIVAVVAIVSLVVGTTHRQAYAMTPSTPVMMTASAGNAPGQLVTSGISSCPNKATATVICYNGYQQCLVSANSPCWKFGQNNTTSVPPGSLNQCKSTAKQCMTSLNLCVAAICVSNPVQ